MLQPIRCHRRQNPSSFRDRSAERNHDFNIRQAEFSPGAEERGTFEGEAVGIPCVVIPRGAAETDHRVLLGGFEFAAPKKLGILIRLEIARPDDYRLRVERGRKLGDALTEPLHEESWRAFSDPIFAAMSLTASASASWG